MNKAGIYYPELDALRFFAFLLVLLHHSPYAGSVPVWVTLHDYGWLGVDLFLCLSAYLFTKLLFVEYQESGDIRIGFFYLRRMLRIWPLYFFFLGTMLAYSIFFTGWHPELLIRSLGMLTFTDNLLSMSKGYNSSIVFSAHLWTISYEEQFYLIIPWALRALYRMKNKTVIYILAMTILFGMSVRGVFIAGGTSYLSIWAFPLTHFESILGGLMIGLGLFDKAITKIPGWVLFITGLISLWLVTNLPNITATQWKLMLTYPLIGIGTSLVLVATIKGEIGFISTLLKNKILGYLGKISYGLYVYHLVAQELSSNIIKNLVSTDRPFAYPILFIITSLIVTIMISGFSYQILERPFLKIKGRFTLIHSRPI